MADRCLLDKASDEDVQTTTEEGTTGKDRKAATEEEESRLSYLGR